MVSLKLKSKNKWLIEINSFLLNSQTHSHIYHTVKSLSYYVCQVFQKQRFHLSYDPLTSHLDSFNCFVQTADFGLVVNRLCESGGMLILPFFKGWYSTCSIGQLHLSLCGATFGGFCFNPGGMGGRTGASYHSGELTFGSTVIQETRRWNSKLKEPTCCLLKMITNSTTVLCDLSVM